MTTESTLTIALHEARAEIERLKKELTYSMMAASAEAERVAELEKEIED